MHINRFSTSLVVAVLLASGSALAGPLSPPAGSVASTLKTLGDVEPRIAINATNTPGDSDSMFKISTPGSYYLTAQVSMSPGKMGIEIACDGVTVDLNGFRIGGFPGSLDGIQSTGINRLDITIRNGMIGPLSGTGIKLGSSGNARGCRIEGVTIIDCGVGGIFVDQDSLISNCLISGCGDQGIYSGNSVRISDCVVNHCGTGMLLSNSGTVERCEVDDNDGDGIVFAGEAKIVGNTCSGNGTASATGAGIHATGPFPRGALIEDNFCTGNDRGVWVEGTSTLIIRNRCSFNATQWLINTGNFYGPIIDRQNAVTAPVNGASAASTLTTADPHANFTF